MRTFNIATDKSHRINREITAPEIRLTGVEGEQIGIVKLQEALRMAEEKDVDLVEIAPTAQPPVCRLMDYGKFKYQEQKKAHEAKLKQKVIQVKEVKFRPGTDDGDYDVKLRNLEALPGRRGSHQDHAAFPWPRNGSPGNRHAHARAPED